MYFLSVILIGTIYPIFLEVISSKKISVGPPFFNKLIIPFLIPFLIFMSLAPNLGWISSKKIEKKIILVVFYYKFIFKLLYFKIIGNTKLLLYYYCQLTFICFFLQLKIF